MSSKLSVLIAVCIVIAISAQLASATSRSGTYCFYPRSGTRYYVARYSSSTSSYLRTYSTCSSTYSQWYFTPISSTQFSIQNTYNRKYLGVSSGGTAQQYSSYTSTYTRWAWSSARSGCLYRTSSSGYSNRYLRIIGSSITTTTTSSLCTAFYQTGSSGPSGTPAPPVSSGECLRFDNYVLVGSSGTPYLSTKSCGTSYTVWDMISNGCIRNVQSGYYLNELNGNLSTTFSCGPEAKWLVKSNGCLTNSLSDRALQRGSGNRILLTSQPSSCSGFSTPDYYTPAPYRGSPSSSGSSSGGGTTGGVIAGLIVLGLIGFCVVAFIQQRRRRQSNARMMNLNNNMQAANQYQQPMMGDSTNNYAANNSYGPSGAGGYPATDPMYGQQPQQAGFGAPPPPGGDYSSPGAYPQQPGGYPQAAPYQPAGYQQQPPPY